MGCTCGTQGSGRGYKPHTDQATPYDDVFNEQRKFERNLPREVPLQEVVNVLNRTHLFRHLPTDDQVHMKLAEAFEIQNYEPYQDIVKQGDVGDAFFAIRSGRVAVIIDNKKVDTWRVGADFGEHGLLHDEPRHATIRAENHVSTLKITRERFWRLGLNRMLQFEGRKAFQALAERVHNPRPEDYKKTDVERQNIIKSMLNNENLQSMVPLEEIQLQKLVDVAWKKKVLKDTEIVVEGEVADCFWIVQEGRFKRLGGVDTNTEGQGGEEDMEVKEAGGYPTGYPTRESSTDSICPCSPGSGKSQSRLKPHRSEATYHSGASVQSEDGLLRKTTSESFIDGRNACTKSEGSVRPKTPADMKKRIPMVIKPGNSFGEVALLYSVPRVATVVALEDSVLWGIDRKHFKDILLALEEEQLHRYMKYIDTVPSLEPLQEDEKHELAQALVEMHFTKGDDIVTQGDPDDSCHLLFEGEVVVMRDGQQEERLRAGVAKAQPMETPKHLRRRASSRVGTPCWAPLLCCGSPSRGVKIQPQSGKTNGQHRQEATPSDAVAKLCHTFGEGCFMPMSQECPVTVKVVSQTAKTLVLFKESFDMLVGDFSILDRTRTVRQERKLSMRGAVRHVTLEELLKGSDLKSVTPKTGRISSNTITRVRALGSGAFGNVELWKDRSGNQYAMKIISKGHIKAMNAQRNVTNERNVMLMTNSPFIVKLYEVYNWRANLYFLMEFVSGGELYTLYNRLGFHGSTPHAKYYTACVVCAFEHLHSLHILYRDLKPENMLIDSRGVPKLTDMGLAVFSIGVTHTFCGTTDYIAPEMIKNMGYTMAIDWWCLGILTFELLSGSPPFESVNPMQTYKRVMKGINYVSFPPKCQGHVGSLIKGLLQKEASDRLPMRPGGLKNLTSHQWYNDFNWTKFRAQTLDAPYVPEDDDKGSVKFNTCTRQAPTYPDYKDENPDFWESMKTIDFQGWDDTPSICEDGVMSPCQSRSPAFRTLNSQGFRERSKSVDTKASDATNRSKDTTPKGSAASVLEVLKEKAPKKLSSRLLSGGGHAGGSACTVLDDVSKNSLMKRRAPNDITRSNSLTKVT